MQRDDAEGCVTRRRMVMALLTMLLTFESF